MLPRVSPGQILRFDYPAANYAGVRCRMEPRRLLVERIRDLADQPLDPITVEQDPLLRRGNVLVTGRDLDKRAERSFYAEAMHNPCVVDPPAELSTDTYRVALLHDESDPEMVFESDKARDVITWAREWLREPIDLAIGLFPPGVPVTGS